MRQYELENDCGRSVVFGATLEQAINRRRQLELQPSVLVPLSAALKLLVWG